MEEYNKFFKYKTQGEFNQRVSYDNLKNRFNILAIRVGQLLERENEIEEIKINETCKVETNPGTRKHYKVDSRLESIPLRIRITVNKGTKGGRIYLSQVIPRPNVNNCDKSILLASKNIVATYSSGVERDSIFLNDNIFFTVEAENFINLNFRCNFGKRISSVKF